MHISEKGLILDIYRHDWKPESNRSNGGISSRFTQALWVGGDAPAPEIFEGQCLPKVVLLSGGLAGTVRVVPLDLIEANRWAMMGGCYIGTSDSRFSVAIELITGGRFYGLPALHDRVE